MGKKAHTGEVEEDLEGPFLCEKKKLSIILFNPPILGESALLAVESNINGHRV
jgi:hypothetical protein